MIEKLTEEQDALRPVFAKKWIDIGLSTAPVNRPEAEHWIGVTCDCAGIPRPKRIIWSLSPMAMAEAYADAIGAKDGDARKKAISSAPSLSIYGSHDAGWISGYDFFREVLGLVKETERLVGNIGLAKSCGWCMPFEEVWFASERMTELHRDDQGRMHNPSGKAFTYPDGWGDYFIHGIRVPERAILDPKSITVKEILSEQNAELARVLTERYGASLDEIRNDTEENVALASFERFLKDSKAKQIAVDDFGELYEIGEMRFVRVVNGTQEPDGTYRRFVLSVPAEGTVEVGGKFGKIVAQGDVLVMEMPEDYTPRMEVRNLDTPRAAVAWTYGMAAEDYIVHTRT